MGHNLVDDGLGVALPVRGVDGMPVKAPRGGLGRWSSTSTPHRGWTPDPVLPFFNWSDTVDLTGDGALYPNERLFYKPGFKSGSLGCTCAMCEMQTILKIFKLRHSDFSEPLYVGEDCAAYMIGSTTLPAGEDGEAADLARVRKIESDAKWYRRLDYEGGAEWEQSTRPIYKTRRVRKAGWFNGIWRDVGEPVIFTVGEEQVWIGSMHGFDLRVSAVRGGWRGWYQHRADDRFSRRSTIVPSRELAQRLTRRAALIAKRTKPWKGEAELADYQATLAQRLKGRES